MAWMSCDTFVALPPATKDGCVIFGKNSDRPTSEVQEVIYIKSVDHEPGAKLQCTYISIDQVNHTYAIILSKPAWIWGAEIGANEHGVCIGNEAVWSKDGATLNEKLLGMDLVRLGLERARTAEEALNVITSLLGTYGQGGPCFDEPGRTETTYENSFLIADNREAWILETAGCHWAAEKVTSGVRNISNLMSIGTQIDRESEGLREHAVKQGYWTPQEGEFNFREVYAGEPTVNVSGKESPLNRYTSGKKLMQQFSIHGDFDVTSMFKVLRNKDGGICRVGDGSVSTTTGSQVSVLPPTGPAIHWFTATPNPSCSVFKPFIFCDQPHIGNLTVSPSYGLKDPARVIPRFKLQVDRQHALYKAHQMIKPLPGTDVKTQTLTRQQELEEAWLTQVQGYRNNSDINTSQIFMDAAQKECDYYHQISN